MRATSVKQAPSWSGDAIDSVVLDYDDRHRRRMAMTGTRGLSFLLDLPEAAFLRHGDALVLEDGRLVEVLAAPEPLLEIRCATCRRSYSRNICVSGATTSLPTWRRNSAPA
jgi:urease accessory protein